MRAKHAHRIAVLEVLRRDYFASQLHHSFGLMRARGCVNLMEIRGIHWFWALYPNLEAVVDKCTCQTGVRLKTHLMAYQMNLMKDDICTSGIRRLCTCSCSCSRAPIAVPTCVQQCGLGNVTECHAMSDAFHIPGDIESNDACAVMADVGGAK